MAYGNTVKTGTGTAYWLLVDSLGRLKIYDDWTPALTSDTGANDSDKKVTVTASQQWRIKSIWVELTTTATVGDRQLVIEIQDDSDDVIAQIRAGAVQAASLTRYYLFAPNVTELTSFRDTDALTTILPDWVLPASYDIRVYDNNAVAAAADDMVIHIQYEYRSV